MTDARSILADFVRRRAIPCPTDDDPDAIYFDNGQAREAMEALAAAGFRILGPDDVQAIRDEALEEAAKVVEDELVEIYEDSPDIDIECNNLARRAAASIRSLKGGRNAD